MASNRFRFFVPQHARRPPTVARQNFSYPPPKRMIGNARPVSMLGEQNQRSESFWSSGFDRYAPDIPLSKAPAVRRTMPRRREALFQNCSGKLLPRFLILNNKPKQTMQRKLTNLTYLAFCAVLALGMSTASAEDKAPSATGNWTWTVPGRDGGAERKMTLTLTQDGEKLTGKLSSPGRDGGAARETRPDSV